MKDIKPEELGGMQESYIFLIFLITHSFGVVTRWTYNTYIIGRGVKQVLNFSKRFSYSRGSFRQKS